MIISACLNTDNNNVKLVQLLLLMENGYLSNNVHNENSLVMQWSSSVGVITDKCVALKWSKLSKSGYLIK